MDDPIERWAPIPGYDGMYEASTLGRIRSYNTSHPGIRASEPRLLKQRLNARGYYWVPLREPDTTRHSRPTHCLVLEAFAGPRPPEHEACHGDGSRTNNRLDNLRWDSRTANMLDKHIHGRWPGRLAHCRSGRHALTPDNLIVTIVDGAEHHRCRACRRERDVDRVARRREQRQAARRSG